jgi:hypothetical protein
MAGREGYRGKEQAASVAQAYLLIKLWFIMI